jgi:hypothetical protein
MHGVNYCCTICMEYLNYGTRSFTVYEKHLEMEPRGRGAGGGARGGRAKFFHCSLVYFF